MARPPRRIAIAATLLATLVLGACKRGGDGAEKRAPEPITLAAENVAVVTVQTLQAGPDISGTLRAKRAAALRAEVGGTVLEVLAEAGEPVKPGQLLARVDDTALRDALLAARSGVSAARNALQVADANAKRARTLAEAGAFATQAAEQAEAALEGARAQVAEAQARSVSAEQQVSKARVRAPFAGVVSERQVSVGDIVAPGAPLFTVIDPGRLQFEASVPAAQVGLARPGSRVDFTVTGFERVFQGEIERVNPAVDPATGQVRVYVDVKNDNGELISGLYAHGRVAAESGTGPSAPASAVDDTTKPPTVMRVVGGKVERVPVEVSLRDDVTGAVGFRSGVKEGDLLVLGSARATLTEGAPVEVAKPAAASEAPAAAQPRSEPERRAPAPGVRPEDVARAAGDGGGR
jgi:membrane fusion protein (multidrug efflux system)